MRASPGLSLLLAGLAGSWLPAPARAQTEPFTAADMLSVVHISGPIARSPSGDTLAYVLPDLSDEWNVGVRLQRGRLYIQRIGSGNVGRPEPVSPVGRWGSFPAFSPDGKRVAFYLEDADGGQLAVWDVRTGRTRTVGVRFQGRAWTPPGWASSDVIVYTRPSAAPAPLPAPRVRVLHSSDPTLPGDAYFRRDRRSGLVAADLGTGAVRTLLDDGAPLRSFAVAPDGRHVLVRTAEPGARPATLLIALDAAGSAPGTDVSGGCPTASCSVAREVRCVPGGPGRRARRSSSRASTTSWAK